MGGANGRVSCAERRRERQMISEERFEGIASLDTPTTDDLVNGLSEEFGPEMDVRYGSLIADKGLWTEALVLAFHADGRVAFRASWALEWAYFSHRESFAPYVAVFFENFLKADNPSVHRSYAKMLCDMLRRGIFVPDDGQAERIAEKSFDLLIGVDTKSAVRIWTAEILYELSLRLDWIGEHLEDVLRRQMESMPTPALLSHYPKLLRRMAGRR